MSRTIMKNVLIYSWILIINNQFSYADTFQNDGLKASLLFSIEITNNIDLEDIGDGGFDIRISEKRKNRLFSSYVSDCSEEIKLVTTNWIKAHGFKVIKSILENGKRYLVHYKDNDHRFFECLYRVNEKRQYAKFSLYRFDRKGQPNSVALDKDKKDFIKDLKVAIRCNNE